MTTKEKDNIMAVKHVASTMSLEEMYFPKEFLREMVKVAKGEISSEEVRKAVIRKYAR